MSTTSGGNGSEAVRDRSGRVVASYATYREASRAVDRLADAKFPVERTRIVGHGLRLVEQVTGRFGVGDAVLRGVVSGGLVGLLIGWLFAVFNWFDPRVAWGWLIFDGLWFGMLLGALFGLVMHAATGGSRDFASVPSMQAERYDLVVDEEVADEAERLLGSTEPAEARGTGGRDMAKAVGIDLGTTNSVVAATMEGGQAEVIPNAEGARTTPSVVAFTEDGQRLVGQVAKRQAILNPEATVYSAKRFIGRKWGEVDEEAKIVSYKVVKGPNDAVRFEIRGKQYAPEEISALILRKLAEDAAKFLGERVTEAVITVPGVLQRRSAPGDQGRRARSPASRSCASSTSRPRRRSPTGSTRRARRRCWSSTSAAARSTSRSSTSATAWSRCAPTSGDGHLGGDDFDKRIVDWLADEFKRDQGIDLRNDPQALQRLYEARRAREGRALVDRRRRRSTCRSSPPTRPGPKHLNMTLTRAKFEQLTRGSDRAHAAARSSRRSPTPS